ncbi:hypothetical protein RHMOL_Rhmol09G0020900 [Rhododendron molle]|uniref:Uncharacterized protein n=1 Tax=Rhododendron molle TaxID=49168 RepID=A0ACC0M8T2_RHOML|nr:hypothetical protein RHMOL_Rhmol09G0020900 [Rhododendron molle]
MGVHVDEQLAGGSRGVYTFRAQGTIYHRIGSLLPYSNQRPRFLQLYIYDTDHEVENRMEESTSTNSSYLINRLLRELNELLSQHNRTISDYDLPSFNPGYEDSSTLPKIIQDKLSVSVSQQDLNSVSALNRDQAFAFHAIIETVERKENATYFIDGPGGTGKTFLYRAILASLRSQGHIALATASSGIAVTLIPGGRTAHSRFKIPLNPDRSSVCSTSKQSHLAELIRRASVILWDEATMTNRLAIEALDRTLRDIMGVEMPFGGKIMVLGGDFRQVLPVVPKGTKAETINASIAKSPLWRNVQVIRLMQNMRSVNDREFSDFLLRVGDGNEPIFDDEMMKVPASMVKPWENDRSIDKLIEEVFPNIESCAADSEYMVDRGLITPKNEAAENLNKRVNQKFSGRERVYYSFDKVENDPLNLYQQEFLNSISPGGLPLHELRLKEGASIMLLRNLDPRNGLCNGTRLLCRALKSNFIDAEILTGAFKGMSHRKIVFQLWKNCQHESAMTDEAKDVQQVLDRGKIGGGNDVSKTMAISMVILWRPIRLEYRSNKFPINVPGLMIPGGPTTATRTRRFLAFPVGKDITQLDHHDLPVLFVPHVSLCRGSHRGWLVIVGKNMTMHIYHPISGVRISLPPVDSLPKPEPGNTRMSKWYVEKAILSAIPLSSSSMDCFVLVFHGCNEMAYCKVGDVVWTAIDGPKRWRYIDAIFYKEVFYIMDHYGGICIFDANLPHPKVTELGISPPRLIPYVQKWYLVEFGGELLQILRKIDVSGDLVEFEEEDIDEGQQNNANEDDANDQEEEFDEFDYDNNYDTSIRNLINQTAGFQLFKLDMSSGLEPKWIDVKDLEGGAVFVGLNQSFALSKPILAGYKGDRIYFTDDNIGSHKLCIRSGNDIGVFNIKDSIFEPLYSTHSESTKPPAVWITPMQY